MSFSSNLGSDLKSLIEREFLLLLDSTIKPAVIDLISNDYNSMLNSVVFNNRSKLNPKFLQGSFIGRLTDFNFIENTKLGLKLHIPDIELFDFSGGLELLQMIIEGLAPTEYVEIDEDARRRLGLPKTIISFMAGGSPVYLYWTTTKLLAKMKGEKVEVLIFPFSI